MSRIIYTSPEWESTLAGRADANMKTTGTEDLRKPYPVVPYTDHFRYTVSKYTPDELRNLLLRAERGQMREQMEFFEDMLERDPVISNAFSIRKQAVVKHEWEFVPRESAGRSRAAQKQVDFLKDVATNLSTDSLQHTYDADVLSFASMLWDSLDHIPMGFSAPRLEWEQNGREWRVIEARHVNQKHFVFGYLGNVPWNPYEVRIRTFDMEHPEREEQQQMVFGIRLPAYRYLLNVYRGYSGYPARAGLLRTLAWPYLLKWYGAEGAALYIESFGLPAVVASYDPNDNNVKAEIEILKNAVSEFGRENRMVKSKLSTIEFPEPRSSSAKELPHERYINMWDNQMLIAVLGQSGTTISTPGKLGEEKEKGDVRDDIMHADARDLEECIQRRFVIPQCLFNFGEVLVDFRIKHEAEEDMNTKADRYAKITSFLSVPESHLREEFDIPEPKDGEAVTAPKSAAAPGAMPFRRDARGRFALAAHGSRRAERIAKIQAASKKLTGIMDAAARKALPVYEALLDGIEVWTNEDAVAQKLNANKKQFKAAFGEIMQGALTEAMTLANNVLGIKPKKLTRDTQGALAFGGRNRLTVKDSTAQDFVKYQGFTVTEIEGEKITDSVLQYVKDNIENALENGRTPVEFRHDVMEGVGMLDEGAIKPWHVDLVYQMNVATAHSVSKYYGFMNNRQFLPCWEFVGTDDSHSCADCPPLIGKVFANSDLTYWPELHFGCRCEGSPIDALEQADENYQITDARDIDNGITPEFKGDPITKYQNYVRDAVKSLPGAKSAIDEIE